MSKAEIASRFPIWRAEHGATWVIPMAGGNTQLQYGRFKDLDMESLRPARDAIGPITIPTLDGKIRGQVRIRDAWRHIDITAKSHAGTRIALGTPKAEQLKLEREGAQPIASAGTYTVNGVRATRLRALYLDDGGAPWVHRYTVTDRTVAAELADMVWDKVIATMRPRPVRASAHNNPWVWVYRLEAR